ncbi:MAG TPA: LuxR C-terminal-related transcriptional regulator, partial [Microbacterium sp.]|nr:LuxR C-terminal-related transcriptional regulator [Microbacterium sp.]
RVLASGEFAPTPRAMAAEALRRLGDLDVARAAVADGHALPLTAAARVQLLVTDALLRHAAGRGDAHVVLERALDVASIEGIRRPFLGLDDDARALLDTHAAWGSRHAVFLGDALSRSARSSTVILSPRELEILAYLRTTLTLTEIAAALYLSTNTVKTHVQSLYRKLGVRSRREATAVRL